MLISDFHLCHICINFLLIFLLIVVHIFLLIFISGNLWIDTRHCEFYVCGAEYFWVSMKYLSIVGHTKISWKQFDPFWIILKCVMCDLKSSQSKDNYLSLLNQDSFMWNPSLRQDSETPKSWGFSSLAGQNRHYFCPSNPFRCFSLPSLRWFPHMHVLVCWILGKLCLYLQSFLSMQLSPLFSIVWVLSVLELLRLSSPSPQFTETASLLLGPASLHRVLETLKT